MTTNVNNYSGVNNDMYWPDTGKVPEEKNNGALTQADFFALLTQQLAYQDPTKPVENDQMIAQMTNFTMADGITALNKNFESLASSMTSNQALQASSLVGRSVLTQSDKILFTGDTYSRGEFTLEKPANSVTIRIEKENGELIHSFKVDNPQLGKNDFAWDGTYPNAPATTTDSDSGEDSGDDEEPAVPRAAPGVYNIKVDVSYTDGTTSSLPTKVYTPVTSVSLGGNNGMISLNLMGLGTVKLSDVFEVSYI
ncbi:flagellar hook assembly protein FlgD [Chromatiaceae bacterium AAb-1]|nr:flagellar hook assembly protein FlgD [Chromatiaceae bacterium AAb-1]